MFCSVVREEFSFLMTDYGFDPQNRINEGWDESCVEFASPRIDFSVYRNYEDGFGIGIHLKTDTFWVRPADSHRFEFTELLEMLDPSVLKNAPQVPDRDQSEESLRPPLRLWATLLRKYAEPLCRGDVSLCEDIHITQYCNRAKGLPLDDYIKIFREECVGLPLADRNLIEQAFASRSPRQICFLVERYCDPKRIWTDRFLQTLEDFRFQYLS